MKLLFAHDHKFHVHNNNFYSNGNFSTEAIKRYTKVFTKTTFVTRQVKVNEKPTKMNYINSREVNFIEVPNFKTIKNSYKIILSNRIIENEVKKSDFVIARNSSIGLIAIKFAKKHKKPYLIEVVSCPWDALWNHSLLGKILAPFYYLRLKKEVKSSSFVIYVTNEFLQSRYPTFGRSVNCSNVSLTNFSDDNLNKRIKRINQIDKKSKIVIGTTAAVNVRYKGQKTIIEALAELKKQGFTNFEYQLVGGGDQTYLRSIAKKLDVSDKVVFLGSMPHEEVFEWLENIDIYAQPSKQEGLPRALIEAMSKGLPAFGARTAGIPELLEEEYIFNYSKNYIKEINSILLGFTKDKMIDQAKRNFDESKKYEREIIENRREKFFKEFINS